MEKETIKPAQTSEIASVTISDTGTTIKEQVASGEHASLKGQKFGTFNGVFRPTILTILGLMMYLREGWLVGNAGLGGAILVILMAYAITGTAALSISSITTNIRLGAGGVFSIISQSLGLEIGGSIGIPFYLAQAFSTAMYIYGFMEGWRYLFPMHSPMRIVLGVFTVIFIVSLISTSFAFRVQSVVMLGTVAALVSIFMGIARAPQLQRPEIWGTFQDGNFWELFSVFFPAATGIMVGAGMSGSLKRPRLSIPVGTLSAWGLSLTVYLALAIWYALTASPDQLKTQMTIAMENAFWGPAVLVGVLSSCFTAALSSFIAAPRILQSLGAHGILPFSSFFSRLNNEEPRNAIAFTGLIVILALLLGGLNTIAGMLTIIYLLTYFMINCVLLIEQSVNLISFRPSFRIPIWIPLGGTFFCLSAILIISPFWGFVIILAGISIYVHLNRSDLHYPMETVRSGIFLVIANWAAKKVAIRNIWMSKRAWKPDFLVPIERLTQFEGTFRLLHSLAHPQGSIQVVGFIKDTDKRPLNGIKELIYEMQEEGLYTSSALIDANDFVTGLKTAVAVMKGNLFQPNVIFTAIDDRSREELQNILNIANDNGISSVLYSLHPEAGFGRARRVNIWIRDQSPHWDLGFNLSHIDLALLMGYKLMVNWNVRLNMICVTQEESREQALKFMKDLMKLARIENHIRLHVATGNFFEFLSNAPRSDINILGLAEVIDKNNLEHMVHLLGTTCLFVHSSGVESVIA